MWSSPIWHVICAVVILSVALATVLYSRLFHSGVSLYFHAVYEPASCFSSFGETELFTLIADLKKINN